MYTNQILLYSAGNNLKNKFQRFFIHKESLLNYIPFKLQKVKHASLNYLIKNLKELFYEYYKKAYRKSLSYQKPLNYLDKN